MWFWKHARHIPSDNTSSPIHARLVLAILLPGREIRPGLSWLSEAAPGTYFLEPGDPEITPGTHGLKTSCAESLSGTFFFLDADGRKIIQCISVIGWHGPGSMPGNLLTSEQGSWRYARQKTPVGFMKSCRRISRCFWGWGFEDAPSTYDMHGQACVAAPTRKHNTRWFLYKHLGSKRTHWPARKANVWLYLVHILQMHAAPPKHIQIVVPI